MFGDGFTHGSPVSSYQSRRSQPASGITESDTGIFRSAATRSEEHTSELQSRLHLVCRLLLEKKTEIQTEAERSGLKARVFAVLFDPGLGVAIALAHHATIKAIDVPAQSAAGQHVMTIASESA